MTAEDLHDALTLLPADLVAEADKRRSRKPQKILWHRWAAMAACLMAILGSSFWIWVSGMRMGSSKSSQMMMAAPAACDTAAPEAAPDESKLQENFSAENGMDASVRAAATGAAMDQGGIAPEILNITWVETPGDSTSASNTSGTPEVHLISNRETLVDYLGDRIMSDEDALRESTDGYDETWFDSHDLVLVHLTCPSKTIVEDIRETGGEWKVTLRPSSLSLQCNYYILLDVEKGSIEGADRITISFAES